jgi:ubiquinol-cytochrome c reductase cytochrome b subunit
VSIVAAAHFVRWGVIQISLPNLLVIGLMVLIFVAALLAPFPPGASSVEPPTPPPSAIESDPPPGGNWTNAMRRRGQRMVPAGQLLPDRQPAYVASWIYVFGVLTLASLVVVIATGLILAIEGSLWWHTSPVGHFVNSAHLWSVQLFFVTMVIHLWGKFFMESWRGKRGLTWATGALAFFGSIGTAFTGYLSQSNFDSQWISTQAKDGLNAAGIGAYFNVLDGSQMLLWHVSLLPLVVGAIVVMHLILVRRHGVAPPIDTADIEAWASVGHGNA